MAIDLDAKGDVFNVITIKAEHRCFAEEAKAVLEDLPKLYPAVKDGEFVPVHLYMPIKFSLN